MLGKRSDSAVSTYLREQILTEGPIARIARVYEMTGVELGRARAALRSGDSAAKGVAVRQASRCLSLLQSSLNRRAGGDVARNLDRVYAYLLWRLTQANIKNDDDALAEVAQHVAELGAAWRQIASEPEAAAATAATAAVAAAEAVAAR